MPAVWLFGATMGLAGFLLFLVQPMAGKFILPWFGGSASTWIVSMLFFQTALLAGYIYAYALTLPLALSTQAKTQIVLVVLALAFLPIAPSDAWKPSGGEDPTWRIIAILAASAGFPYMALAATTPLLSRWLARAAPAQSPAPLFAVANAGAFLGLIAYPFIFEPLMTTRQQALVWSAGFVLYAALLAACALALLRADAAAGGAAPNARLRLTLSPAPLVWIGFSALGSVLLLATSNAITLYSAVVPFLWVLPLGLYLLSFVAAFGAPRFNNRAFWSISFLLLCGVELLLTYPDTSGELVVQIAVESGVLFAGCMICHGELARRQPAGEGLPGFYLAVAAGGALGGLLTAVVAPLAFDQYYEHYLTLAVVALVACGALLGPRALAVKIATGVAGAFFAIGAAFALQNEFDARGMIVERVRNFYGVLEVVKEREGDPEKYTLALRQAGVDQGWQYQKDEFRLTPPCGYDEASALGLALGHKSRRPGAADAPLRIGVVGLGAGMVAGLGHTGDVLRYYELNPAVVDLAHRYFSFLRDGKAKADVLIGDARLTMERQLQRGDAQQFDILVMNAFRGATPPMHLMTREAFEIYLAHLTSTGILAINFDVDTFEMAPLHRGMARAFGLHVRWFETPRGPGCEAPISWALYTRDPSFFNLPDVALAASAWRDGGQSEIVWTDRSSNLMSILNMWSRQ
jgi:hypothetical protein